jgi:hypothetical protein
MQHTHYQRSIVVLLALLIVGGFLQGCGGPNWKPEQTDSFQVSQDSESAQPPRPSQNAARQNSEESAISNKGLEQTGSLQVSPGSESTQLPRPSQNAECQSFEEHTISNRELEQTDSPQVSQSPESTQLPRPPQNPECQGSEAATISWGGTFREVTLPVLCEGDLLPVSLYNPKGAELGEDARCPAFRVLLRRAPYAKSRQL